MDSTVPINKLSLDVPMQFISMREGDPLPAIRFGYCIYSL